MIPGKENPPAARTETAGEIKNHFSDANDTPQASPRQLRPGTKLASIAAAFLRREVLDCFQACRVYHDFCLHSTVSELEHRYGVTIQRETKRIPGFAGKLVTCCNYWVDDESRDQLREILGGRNDALAAES